LLLYYYSAGDVVVTTPWYEPFGLTPLEGMACARPVIGSEVGGIMYSVVDGKTGLLVPPHRPDILAECLYYLLKHPQYLKSMGRAARKRVLRDFTWSRVAEQTAQVYQEAAEQTALQPHLANLPWSMLLDAPSVGGGE
jgi:D-inositol-3-phosphate glycosyltransferase